MSGVPASRVSRLATKRGPSAPARSDRERDSMSGVPAPGDVLLETPVGKQRVAAVKIPVARHISPEFYEREMADMWPRTWQLACTVDHVANPGDWHEYRVGRLSVLIVRGDDGVLRAFQNVCLHRGSELCSGSGRDLAEIRCPFHRWTWGLDGRLREVPSRREFGVLNDDYPLIGVQVDTWGPMVFVNLDPGAAPLAEFLDPVPDETAWANLEEFRGQALVSVKADCNWKTLIEGFSETYHVQGIHREMLGMADDVNGPQAIWPRHGRLVQSYGLPSPRQGRAAGDDDVFASFVEVMGGRIGVDDHAAPMPPIPEGRPAPDAGADGARREPRPGRRPLVVQRPPRTRHGAVQPVSEHHRARVRRHAVGGACPSRYARRRGVHGRVRVQPRADP